VKKLVLVIGLVAAGFMIGSINQASEVDARTNVIGVKLCALKKTGAVRYTTKSCKTTERSVPLESEALKWDLIEQINKSLAPTLKTKKIAIDYLGIPSTSWWTPGCGSNATAFDASGSILDASYGYWIFGAGITPPSRMSTLTIDPLVLSNGSNWKQVAKCRLEVTVVVPG
jgi:hypothetical protein